MHTHQSRQARFMALLGSASALGLGLLIGGTSASAGESRLEPPTEHRGVSVTSLGVVSEESLGRQIGLGGHVLQLREIILAPGGAIAPHSHANRPGLAWTVEGSWTEVRRGHPGIDGGARNYPAGNAKAIVEGAGTDHWFFNNGQQAVRVLVCDIVPTP